MAEKIHIIIQEKDMNKLRALAFKNNLSCSTVADVIGLYYVSIARKHEIKKEDLENPRETVFKIRTQKNMYRQEMQSPMTWYSTCLYYYFNQNKLLKEEREQLKQINKKIAKELETRKDPNALYNQVIRMQYRANKELKK